MKVIVKKSDLKGTIIAPSSKSYFQRAIAVALLTDGISNIYFKEHCQDTLAALDIIKTLGAEINNIENGISINGGFNPKSSILNCNESGLCMRMFSPITALLSVNMTLTGSGSLLSRNQTVIIDSLSPFGIDVYSDNTFAPIHFKGPLTAGKVVVDGSLSSQVVSGLLIALPILNQDSELEIQGMVSHKYIDMTIDTINKFGVHVEKSDNNSYLIPGKQIYKACDYRVEGDWSGASFLIIAGLISGNIKIQGLNINSLQADRAILDLLSDQNYNYSISESEIEVKTSELNAFEFDATNCPDLFPPLVSLAAFSNGISKIKGVHRLYNKESDRANSLVEEFKKLGIICNIEDDVLSVQGGKIKPSEVSSHNDHRIAMSLSIVALNSEVPIVIEGVECVSKSYPYFFTDLEQLNAKIESVRL